MSFYDASFDQPKADVSTGTTLVAITYDEGVVVGTDSRTSSGAFIASRVTDKITEITKQVVGLRAGSAAFTQQVANYVRYVMEVREIEDGISTTVLDTAYAFGDVIYAQRKGGQGSLIVAGYDEAKGAQVYAVPNSGCYSEEKFAAGGSGCGFILGYIDSRWKEGMTREQAASLTYNAVRTSIMRDGHSGGVIRLAFIDKNGITRALYRPDRPVPFPNEQEKALERAQQDEEMPQA